MHLLKSVGVATLVAAASAVEMQYFDSPPVAADPNITVQHVVLSSERQGLINAVLSTIASPVGFVHPMPSMPDGCTGMTKTSKVATTAGCKFAING